jgi:lysophospholipase L1-like esterase
LGDSITWGFTPRNVEATGTQLQSYAKLTADSIAEEFTNAGINGSTLAALAIGTEERSPMVYRVDSLPSDADLITVMGGTNDYRQGISLGTINDTTEITYYGALKVLCEKLVLKYQTSRANTNMIPATVVLFTPLKFLSGSHWVYNSVLQAWANAVKEVGVYYSLPVLDLHNISMVNPHVGRTLQGADPTSPGIYSPLVPDGVHPSALCHRMIARITTGYLRTKSIGCDV